MHGWPELEAEPQARPGPASSPDDRPPPLLLLADPFSFPTDLFLKRLSETMPGTPVLGGMASGSNVADENRFVLDGTVVAEGAVAVELSGPLRVRSIVSQGCRPIGPTMIVTKVDQNVIRELGRRPALEVVREVFANLPEEDQERVQQGLHIGRVINEYQEKFQRGDFLVRNVIGSDEAGGIAITDVVRVGQTVQFHVRDAETADEDLRSLLSNERQARAPHPARRGPSLHLQRPWLPTLPQAPPRRLDHSRAPWSRSQSPASSRWGRSVPSAVRTFVHGFTASIALFEEA